MKEAPAECCPKTSFETGNLLLTPYIISRPRWSSSTNIWVSNCQHLYKWFDWICWLMPQPKREEFKKYSLCCGKQNCYVLLSDSFHVLVEYQWLLFFLFTLIPRLRDDLSRFLLAPDRGLSRSGSEMSIPSKLFHRHSFWLELRPYHAQQRTWR